MRCFRHCRRAAIFCLFVFISVALVVKYPVLAATVCPSCYGVEWDGESLLIDRDMPSQQRDALRFDIKTAVDQVSAFYGGFSVPPVVIACASRDCDSRLGGRGARGMTYSLPFRSVVQLAPNGLNLTILTHEFSHVELHHRVGLMRQILGKLPAWFDEGLAVIVSNDERYLRPGSNAAERCLVQSSEDLPISPFDWAPLSGKRHELYAIAACRVLQWMDAHGGQWDLLQAEIPIGQ